MSTSELVPTAPTTSDTSPHTAAPAPTGERTLTLTVEQLAYIGIALLSLLLHLWGLGDRALHHDETLHAYYSWRIYVGEGYMHDPLLHGPVLYYLGALSYFLFGDNDFTARLSAALFGTVLTLLPLLVRRELGRPAALLASVYLLISPTFLYVGRFFRHDIYSMVFEMLVFVAIVRYASTRQARWLYMGAAAFALMYANQETSYLFLLIMATPLVVLLLWRVYKPGIAMVGALGVALALLVFVLPGEAQVDGGHVATRDEQGNMVVAEPGPLFGWGPLQTEDNSYALNVRNRADTFGARPLAQNFVEYVGQVLRFVWHPAILTGLVLFVGVSALLVWLIWLRRDAQGLSAWQRARAGDERVLSVYESLLTGWRWLVALLIFFAIYTVLFTAFFTNIIGVVSGTTGSLLYWLAQHNVERGSQPPYYYLVQLAIYEPLALMWALIGVLLVVGSAVWWLVARTRRRDATDSAEGATNANLPSFVALAPLPLLLAWWSLAALGIYSWAGEKMPWLTVHVLLPMVLLGAWTGQRVVAWAFGGQMVPPARRAFLAFASIFLLILGLGFVRMAAYVGAGAPNTSTPLAMLLPFAADTGVVATLVVLLVLVLLSMLLIGAGLLRGPRWTLGALVLCVALVGGIYSVRNAYRLSFAMGDVPREMLIYTQTSPDVMQAVRRLETVSRLRTDGLDMPIIHDNETVWLWYLRDFTNVQKVSGPLTAPPGDDIQAVLMLQENVTPDVRDYLSGFRMQRYPLRWWFPEGQMYRKDADWREVELEQASLLTRVMRAPLDNDTLVDAWGFLIYRNFDAPLGSTDFIIAVRPDIADQMAPGFGAE